MSETEHEIMQPQRKTINHIYNKAENVFTNILSKVFFAVWMAKFLARGLIQVDLFSLNMFNALSAKSTCQGLWNF